MRAPVASSPFGSGNTTRRLSFAYRLLDREPGRRFQAGSPALCTTALARKARTELHYPLPFTVDDVGVAGCTTTCSFAGLHSRPEPVREPRYFRASLGRYLRRLPSEDERTGLAWVDRAYNSAGRHELRPFHAVTDAYRRQAAHTATTEVDAVNVVENRGVEPRAFRLQGGRSPN